MFRLTASKAIDKIKQIFENIFNRRLKCIIIQAYHNQIKCIKYCKTHIFFLLLFVSFQPKRKLFYRPIFWTTEKTIHMYEYFDQSNFCCRIISTFNCGCVYIFCAKVSLILIIIGQNSFFRLYVTVVT